MVKMPVLTIDELGKLAGLLTRYAKELQYEATDGAALDEPEEQTAAKLNALESVERCLKVVRADLILQLS